MHPALDETRKRPTRAVPRIPVLGTVARWLPTFAKAGSQRPRPEFADGGEFLPDVSAADKGIQIGRRNGHGVHKYVVHPVFLAHGQYSALKSKYTHWEVDVKTCRNHWIRIGAAALAVALFSMLALGGCDNPLTSKRQCTAEEAFENYYYRVNSARAPHDCEWQCPDSATEEWCAWQGR